MEKEGPNVAAYAPEPASGRTTAVDERLEETPLSREPAFAPTQPSLKRHDTTHHKQSFQPYWPPKPPQQSDTGAW